MEKGQGFNSVVECQAQDLTPRTATSSRREDVGRGGEWRREERRGERGRKGGGIEGGR